MTFFINNVFMGCGFSMDAFSVSMANGLDDSDMKIRKAMAIALVFGIFQGMMPFIGWVLVNTLAGAFLAFRIFIPWISLFLLSFIGGKMLLDGFSQLSGSDQQNRPQNGSVSLSFSSLVAQGVATSIDALSAGFVSSEYNIIEVFCSTSIIALTTFVICFVGVMIGRKFGNALAGKAAILGGTILIFIGFEIFISSLIR